MKPNLIPPSPVENRKVPDMEMTYKNGTRKTDSAIRSVLSMIAGPQAIVALVGAAAIFWLSHFFVTKDEYSKDLAIQKETTESYRKSSEESYSKDQANIVRRLDDIGGDVKELLKERRK